MSTPIAIVAFVVGAVVSLATSWVLVSRIERIGGRLGASEAMLGLLAALAADTPEISSAVSALAHHQQNVGVGVVLGSNVFNLAALLGLGAMVGGGIALHRRVVALEGAIGVWVAAVTVLTVLGVATPAVGLVLVLAALVPYVMVAGLNSTRRRARLGSTRLRRWLGRAIAEEELELGVAIHPRPGRFVDVAVGLMALVVVVTASVVMERATSTLGRRFSVADIVVGTVVLAAVTSLPNAVAALYLARRGRGAASLSIALNSNALNVAAGLLVPAVVLGIGPATANVSLVASWYAGLTVLLVGFAYFHRGVRFSVGALIVASYLAFVATVWATGSRTSPAGLATYLLPPVVIVGTAAILLIWPPPHHQTRRLSPSRRAYRRWLRKNPSQRRGVRGHPTSEAKAPPGELVGHPLVAPRRDPLQHGRCLRCSPRPEGDPHGVAHRRPLLCAAHRALAANRVSRRMGIAPRSPPRHPRRHLGHRHTRSLSRCHHRGQPHRRYLGRDDRTPPHPSRLIAGSGKQNDAGPLSPHEC